VIIGTQRTVPRHRLFWMTAPITFRLCLVFTRLIQLSTARGCKGYFPNSKSNYGQSIRCVIALTTRKASRVFLLTLHWTPNYEQCDLLWNAMIWQRKIQTFLLFCEKQNFLVTVVERILTECCWNIISQIKWRRWSPFPTSPKLFTVFQAKKVQAKRKISREASHYNWGR